MREKYNFIIKSFNSKKIPLKKLNHCTINIQGTLGAGCVARAGSVAGVGDAALDGGKTREA